MRLANRVRQRERPQDPDDLTFTVDNRHVPDGFLKADVHAGDRRHIIFATDQQLAMLANAQCWYADGTFWVVKEPFVQLWSLHAYFRAEGCVKQMPLVFVLMSGRRRKDYKKVGISVNVHPLHCGYNKAHAKSVEWEVEQNIAVLIQYRSVTDTHRHRQTDRQTHDDGMYRASVASCGKNVCKTVLVEYAFMWCCPFRHLLCISFACVMQVLKALLLLLPNNLKVKAVVADYEVALWRAVQQTMSAVAISRLKF